MPAACALGVVGVNDPAFKGGNGVVNKSRFIQGIGMNGYLHIVFFGYAKAGVY